MDDRNNDAAILKLLQENEEFASALHHFLKRYVKFSDAFNYVREWFVCGGDHGANFTMKLLRRYRGQARIGTEPLLTASQKNCLVAMHYLIDTDGGSSVDSSIAGVGESSSSGEAGASGYDGDLG